MSVVSTGTTVATAAMVNQQQQQQQSTTLASTSSSAALNTFNFSPSADILRSYQKDDYHLSRFRSEVSELASSLLGSRAGRYESELELLTKAAYYGTQSLAGTQTLGEEYCDVAQVAVRGNVKRELARKARSERAAATAANSTSSASSPPSIAAASSSVAPAASSSPQPPSSSTSSASPLSSVFLYAPYTPLTPHHRITLFTWEVILPYLHEKVQKYAGWIGRRVMFDVTEQADPRQQRERRYDPNTGYEIVTHIEDRGSSSSPSILSRIFSYLLLRLKSLWNRSISLLLHSDYTLFSTLTRLNLALFYLFSRYLEIAKRMSGVRYVQLRSLDVSRPSYRLFGVLMMVQVIYGIGQILSAMITRMWRSNEQDEAVIDGDGVGNGEQVQLPGIHYTSQIATSPASAAFGSSSSSSGASHRRFDSDTNGSSSSFINPLLPSASNLDRHSRRTSTVPPDIGAAGILGLAEEPLAERRRRHHQLAESQQHQSRPSWYHPHDATHESKEQHNDEEQEEEDEAPNCMLCLCSRTNTTATQCGHLYCWSCISEALSNKPECPMCRQPSELNTLLLLAHYK